MNCNEARQLLHAYVDNELDAATAGRLNAHMLECAACAQSLEAAKAVKLAAGNAALYHGMPAALREQIVASLPAPPRVKSKWFSRAMAIAAAVVLMSGIGLLVINRDRPVLFGQSADQLALLDLHLRSMQLPEHLIDVVSTDQHTVKPWFAGKLDFAPPVWQLSDKGFALVGGRTDFIHGRPAAALVYRRAQHVINLFIWRGDVAASQTTAENTAQGYHFKQWSAGGMTFCAVSDASADELEKFSELYRAGPE